MFLEAGARKPLTILCEKWQFSSNLLINILLLIDCLIIIIFKWQLYYSLLLKIKKETNKTRLTIGLCI